jgi:gas vesicle structural protein
MAIQSGAPAGAAGAQRSSGSGNLAELLGVILDKGIVIDAWARVSVIGIEILTVEARVVVSSVETYLRYAEAIGLTAMASPPNQQGQQANGGRQAGGQQAALPAPSDVQGYLEDNPEGVPLGDLQAYFDAPRDDLSEILQTLESENKVRQEQDRYFPAGDNE